MSLNSYVTVEGGEIGIAQAIQAYAAKLDPHVDMNPILLKPKGDSTSQIILLGRPFKDLPITEYYREVDHLLETVLESAYRLMNQYGHIVVEGAGGAAEMNLYDRDIANIRLARALKVPIILVADIERGGVFAMVYGTLALLPSDVRAMVRGIIINKFRGDRSIFAKGIRIIEELTRVPVLGILPYTDIQLPSEDSLSIDDKKLADKPIRIAIIRFPHISNFTDFELLERYASVNYVPMGAPLSGYDCIILPGTKNTVEDLVTLTQSNMAHEIVMARNKGIPIIGICGGYQILGREIIDSGIESRAGIYKGIGLFDVVTKFSDYKKNTRQIRRRALRIPPILSEIGEVQGYEIHMGDTERNRTLEAFEGEGSVSSDGLIIGTYIHGLFNNIGAVNALLSYLYSRKSLKFEPISTDLLNKPYDACAQWFENHVDMEKVVSLFKD